MTSTKQQVVFIHGGESFETKEEFYEFIRNCEYDPYEPERRRWRDSLKVELEEKGYEWIFLQMPCRWNAEYNVWYMWFQKLVPYLRDDVILIGHSLGASFFVKYLYDQKIPVSIAQLHLVAPAVIKDQCEGLGGFATDLELFSGFQNNIPKIHIYHSVDDEAVPYIHSEKLAEALSAAHFHKFTDRGHFLGEDFPEIKVNILS